MLYNSERDSLAKLAPRLTAKSCYPSSLERQNVKLFLKVVHESTIAGLAIQNVCWDSPSLWKIFNVNMPYKHVRLNDPMSKPLTFNDERFIFLTQLFIGRIRGGQTTDRLGILSGPMALMDNTFS